MHLRPGGVGLRARRALHRHQPALRRRGLLPHRQRRQATPDPSICSSMSRWWLSCWNPWSGPFSLLLRPIHQVRIGKKYGGGLDPSRFLFAKGENAHREGEVLEFLELGFFMVRILTAWR